MRFAQTAILILVSFGLGVAGTHYYDIRQTPKPVASAAPAAPAPAAAPPLDLQHEPLWAYGFDKPAQPGDVAKPQGAPSNALRPNEDADEQTRPRKLEGSTVQFSLQEIRDGQNVVDWFPKDHPPMPDVVKHGPAGMGANKRGCASCHLPTGRGRPENAPPGGLPVEYIMRQLQNFRSGKRKSADPRKPNTNTMIDLAKGLSDDELKAAAEYFSSIPWKPWVRVVETDMVPKTHISNNLFLPLEKEMTEPIGDRIIEVPENEELAETYRSPHSGFVAYVPKGSLAKGKDLVTTGGARIEGSQFIPGKSTPCITCHREDLLGAGDAPPIAGRSPSYIAREMWDIQQGTRHDDPALLMKMAIDKLTPGDLIAVAAYVASVKVTPRPLSEKTTVH